MKKYIFRCVFLSCTSLSLLSVAYAASHKTATNLNEFFPLVSRASGWGLTGSNQLVGGDAMLPLFGRDDRVLFLDAQAKAMFGDPEWLASLGAGVRVVQNEEQILGAYLFLDRTVSQQNNQFWFISPGVESMGQVWDFRVNGYIPTSSNRILTGTGFASDFGDFSHVVFNQHSQLDLIVNNFEEVGWGGDAEVGRNIQKIPGLRAYVGGYHFNFDQANDINGVAGRVEYLVNPHVAFSVRDSYDNNQSNTFEAEVRFTFGGVNKHPHNIHQPIRERLLDPIPRNMATLGEGAGEPVVSEQQFINNGSDFGIQRSNIWFFDPSSSLVFGGITTCTIEHPCSDTAFDQSTIDQINAFPLTAFVPSGFDPAFYFKTGDYNALNGVGPITLTDDSLYSRTFDYSAPQLGAIFNGGFVVNGTSLFSAITMLNNPDPDTGRGVQPVAIILNTNGVLTLDNSIIGVDTHLSGTNYHTDIQMSDGTLSLNNNSELHAFNHNTSTNDAFGVDATDAVGSTISMNHSSIVVTQFGFNQMLNYTGEGISLRPQLGALNTTATVNLTNDSVIQANGAGNFGLFTIAGIASTENTNNVSVTDNSSVVGAAPIQMGGTIDVWGINLTGNTNTVLVSDDSIVGASADMIAGSVFNPPTLFPIGIGLVGDNNTVTVLGSSQVNAAVTSANVAQQTFARGIYIDSRNTATNTITINNSQVNVDNQVDTLVPLVGDIFQARSRGIFIDVENLTGTATNLINILNNSQVNAMIGAASADGNGVPAQIVAEGINIEASNTALIDNVNNTINITGSTVNAQNQLMVGDITGAGDPSVVNAFGINIKTGNNSSNNLNVSASTLQATASIGIGDVNFPTAAGINITLGDAGTNTVDIVNESLVQANATLTTGNNNSNTVAAAGIFASVGNDSSDTLTLGAVGDATDTSNVQANATLTDAGGANASNTATVYGINADNNSECSGCIPTTNVTNIITMQGLTVVDVAADIVTGSASGANDSTSQGIFVSGESNMTILVNSGSSTNPQVASSASSDVTPTVQATGIQSIAPLITNVVDNQVEPSFNANITAKENTVDNPARLIIQTP